MAATDSPIKPLTVIYTEDVSLPPVFVVQLLDGVTGAADLAGAVQVTVDGRKPDVAKPSQGVFAFFALPDGTHDVAARSDPNTPFYLDLAAKLDSPSKTAQWPAWPDLSLADRTLPLDDPGQPPAYKTQRIAATLQPAPQYPFPAGVTLVRGAIRLGKNPLPGAVVEQVGSTHTFTTGATGEYVLYLSGISGMGKKVKIRASHPAHAAKDTDVVVQRGTSTSVNFDLS
jgi:hypothetical protein